MNLAATLKWATMVLWHLSHPHSNARREMTTARMNEKLGWLRKYRDDIERWLACQSVVSASLTFINEQAVFPTAKRFYSFPRYVGGKSIRALRTFESSLHPTFPCEGYVSDITN